MNAETAQLSSSKRVPLLFVGVLLCLHIAMVGLFVATKFLKGDLQQYQPRVQAMLQQATGLDWQFETLSLNWKGLNPVIDIDKLEAHLPSSDQQSGQQPVEAGTVLALDKLHIYVDVGASLWSRQLRLFGVRASHAEIVLQQRDGKFSLPGMTMNGGGNFSAVDFIAQLRYASLPDIRVAIVDDLKSADDVSWLPALAFEISAQESAVATLSTHSASPDETGTLDGLQFLAEASGDWLESGSALSGYFELDGPRGEQWSAALGKVIELKGLSMQAWLRKPAFGRMQAVARLEDADFVLPERVAHFLPADAQSDTRFTNTDGELNLNWRSASHFSLAWRKFSVDLNQRSVVLPDGRYSASSDWLQRQRTALVVDSMDLVSARRELAALNLLPAALAGVLDDMDPKGTLRDIEFTITDIAQRDFALSAQLEDLHADAWKGAPGVSGLHGTLEMDAGAGVFRFQESDPFSVSFPKIYRKPLAFSSASGELRWRMDGKRLLIESSELDLSPLSHDALLGAKFDVNVRTSADDLPNHIRLKIGYENADVKNLVQYMPYTLPNGLRQWLSDSAVQGPSNRGGFIYNGSLGRDDKSNRVMHLFLGLDGASANYANGWQRAEELYGELTVTPTRTDAVLRSGKIEAVPFSNSRIAIYSGQRNQRIALDTDVGGSFGSALALLKGSPVGEDLLPVIKDWRGGGSLDNGRLSFVLPLRGDLLPTMLSFSASLASGSLLMPALDMTLENLRGPIAYDLQHGLHSAGMRASVFGEPWKIELGKKSDGASVEDRSTQLHLAASGLASVTSVKNWLKLPVLGFASGKAAFDLELEQTAAKSELRVSSDLRGVAVEAPLPFYKLAPRVQPMAMRWDLRSASQPLVLTMPGWLEALFDFEQFSFVRGSVHLGDNAGGAALASAIDASPNGAATRNMNFTGSLDRFNFASWKNAYDRYQKFSAAITTSTNSTPLAPLRMAGKSILIHQATMFGQQAESAKVDFADLGDDFRVYVDSKKLKGEVVLPTANITPGLVAALRDDAELTLAQMPSLPEMKPLAERIRVSLDYLHLDKWAEDTSSRSADSGSSFSPELMSAMSVNVNELTLDREPFGAWRFLLSASESAALAHNVEGRLHGLVVSSEQDDGLLWAYDNNGALNTAMNATVNGNDLGAFLENTLDDPAQVPIRAESLAMGVALSWPGDPLDAELLTVNGDIDVAVGAGQFYRASESAAGFLKLLGLFNFDALLRRMQLDFRDVYKEGLSFDSIEGELSFEGQRVDFSRSPIEVRSPSSKFILAGSVDLPTSTIDAELIATMPVANNLPWIAALAGGLPVAAGTFIVTRVLGDQFDQLSSAVYSVQGPMDEPEVKFQRLFDNKKTAAATPPPIEN